MLAPRPCLNLVKAAGPGRKAEASPQGAALLPRVTTNRTPEARAQIAATKTGARMEVPAMAGVASQMLPAGRWQARIKVKTAVRIRAAATLGVAAKWDRAGGQWQEREALAEVTTAARPAVARAASRPDAVAARWRLPERPAARLVAEMAAPTGAATAAPMVMKRRTRRGRSPIRTTRRKTTRVGSLALQTGPLEVHRATARRRGRKSLAKARPKRPRHPAYSVETADTSDF